MFFSEEKNQKTFIPCAGPNPSGQTPAIAQAQRIKVFLLLFLQKKKTLPSTQRS
jgi:hypothetical protein